MKAKVLTPDQWERIKSPTMPPSFRYADPRETEFVVIEDENGTIVASLGVMRITHLEGLWVDPAHKKNPAVMRKLLQRAAAIAQVRGEEWVMGGADHDADKLRGYLIRLGGVQLPIDIYALPVGGKN